MDSHDLLPIGQLALRAGVSSSTLRYYEAEGLIEPADRNSGGHRRYPRETLRRVAFIRSAQRVGLTLEEIREALQALPERRTPTAADWADLGTEWRERLNQRIEMLESLRDDLDSCIGCGCLSLDRCRLYNPDDAAARLGHGPRYLLGNTSEEALSAETRRSRVR